MSALIIIEAAEGCLGEIFAVSTGRDGLCAFIRSEYDRRAKSWPHEKSRKENTEYLEKSSNALIAMIEAHQDWSAGRHILPPIEPLWGEWSLLVLDDEPFSDEV